MQLEDIFITLNDGCNSTSGIALPNGVYFVCKADLQALNVVNDNYHVFVDAYYNEACFTGNKSPLRIENVHTMVVSEELGTQVVNQVELIIPTNGEDDVDTLEKKKALIISELASKQGKETNLYS